MDIAGTAVGIASLGIQVCQGLLAFYDTWKDYHSDITGTCKAVADLSQTLALLEENLKDDHLAQDKKANVGNCLQSCQEDLGRLSKKLEKLKSTEEPKDLRQRTFLEVRRLWYPFRASTLAKLREIVDGAQERLKLALEVLLLDVGIGSRKLLVKLSADVDDVVIRTRNIEAQTQRILDTQQAEEFEGFKTWLSPSDPRVDYEYARGKHTAGTGAWLLGSGIYQKWKEGSFRHLWLHGKAGCGKTILSSVAITDLQSHCETEAKTNIGLAFFYFTFSEEKKQSYESLLRSLAVQLGATQLGVSLLVQAYKKRNQSSPDHTELENIVVSCAQSYDKYFLVLDALDECPEEDGRRTEVLNYLERLTQAVPGFQLFITSREVPEIRDCMTELGANPMPVDSRAVNVDVLVYVSGRLKRDRKLSRLDEVTKELIKQTITEKADGMFRWAYCQMEELQKLKVINSRYVKEKLRSLPATLDETYERMLHGIDDIFRKDALTWLLWLSYVQRPLTLGELAETTMIDPAEEGAIQEKSDTEDALKILVGLVSVGYEGSSIDQECDNETSIQRLKISSDTKVQLAHFSVKEYLESSRLLKSSASAFHHTSSRGHKFLTQSCIGYLIFYSRSAERLSQKQDLDSFPLLDYTASQWFHHSKLQQTEDPDQEVLFFRSQEVLESWLFLVEPEQETVRLEFQRNIDDAGSGLYYASCLGLEHVVRQLIDLGVDLDDRRGPCGCAISVASAKGHEKVVRLLLDAGADVDTQGGELGSALQAAVHFGNEKIVQMLLEAGADANLKAGEVGTALHAAAHIGSEKIVEMLIDAGADVDLQGGEYGNALQAASYNGNEKVVRMLLDAGPDVNAQGGYYGNAAQAAACCGHLGILRTLKSAGADIHAQGGDFGNTLQAAAYSGQVNVVQWLLDEGADTYAEGEYFYHALDAAAQGSFMEVVNIILKWNLAH